MKENKIIVNHDHGKKREQKDVIQYFTTLLGMSDASFDNLLQEKIDNFGANINERALIAHGIDADEVKEIAPIKIENYYPKSRFFKISRDLSCRASEYQIAYLMFSNKQMFAYSHIFDMTSDDTIEITKEYFYENITNVEVEKKEIDLPNPRHWIYIVGGIIAIILGLVLYGNNFGNNGSTPLIILGSLFFVLAIVLLFVLGYTRSIAQVVTLKLTVPSDEFVCAMKSENISAIQGIKAKIREKKM